MVVEPVKKFTDELVQGLGNGEYAGDGRARDGKDRLARSSIWDCRIGFLRRACMI